MIRGSRLRDILILQHRREIARDDGKDPGTFARPRSNFRKRRRRPSRHQRACNITSRARGSLWTKGCAYSNRRLNPRPGIGCLHAPRVEVPQQPAKPSLAVLCRPPVTVTSVLVALASPRTHHPPTYRSSSRVTGARAPTKRTLGMTRVPGVARRVQSRPYCFNSQAAATRSTPMTRRIAEGETEGRED